VYIGIDFSFYKRATADIIESIKKKYNINGDYILYLGTLEPRKNLERLIEAYAAVKESEKAAPLLVIAGGKGWLYESIFETVKRFGIENSVIFTGYVPDADKPALLSGAKVFCFPSLYEGFGMPPLEAMACGTPVLTSNVASLPEVCGDAAYYVNPLLVSEIEQGIKQLCFNEELRNNLIQKGEERVKLFSWDKIAEQLHNLYQELVNEKD
jgi:glycosyltransferase involved in cell wall biosynthesis